jgi:hypothetical protein
MNGGAAGANGPGVVTNGRDRATDRRGGPGDRGDVGDRGTVGDRGAVRNDARRPIAAMSQ